ncbi:MAG TPA: DNA starvation/stationary phase protection protein [Bryobacteraceae bacterium]|jgi:starvation-inducible DNA-binding protein|nr:DNA starvation/stationary phase protection protein [Bryobacteraceae bacterium]
MPTTEDKVEPRRRAPALATPTDLEADAVKNITGGLNALLADVFALYVKTKNFHWHVSGPHFRDYHLLLDEHAEQIFKMTDDIAERVRKIGGTTVRSIGQIGRLQRLSDNDAEYVDPPDMLAELREDNRALLASMREMHDLCDDENDVATTSMLEVWIDETERRVWFLFETSRTR